MSGSMCCHENETGPDEKLALLMLMGELTAGNISVLPQIVVLLSKLHKKNQISYKDYNTRITVNNWVWIKNHIL